MIRYMLTIFLSAFLLFQVQPIVGRFVLPWFGGSAAVWNTCMLFFQIALLIGYCYSHLVTKYLQPKQQWLLHMSLLGISAFFLPVQPSDYWKPNGDENITVAILTLLTVSIGLPFVMVSTTGPLIQAWQSRTHPKFPTYRLFALSNAGSLVALLSYPFLIEPFLKRGTQSIIWTIGYIGFALLCSYSGWQVFRRQADAQDGEPDDENIVDAFLANDDTSKKASKPGTKPGVGLCVLWCLLAAAASAMLLATTNQMCQEVASVPFLWILPLSLYLLTFIICFDSPRWYLRSVFLPLLLISSFLGTYLLVGGVSVPLPIQVLGYALVLFSCCMSCHGELSRLKPSTQYLTLFYLMVSVGGAMGGLFIVLVAPNVFTGYHEFNLLLIFCSVLCVGVFYLNRMTAGKPIPLISWLAVPVVASASVLIVLQFTWEFDTDADERIVHKSRNSYGTITVKEWFDDETKEPISLTLYNGRIKHGSQRMRKDLQFYPISYYSEESGVGRSIDGLRLLSENRDPLKIGVIGLGTGTMAAWGKKDDEVVFYEINPQVRDVAESKFDYLKTARKNGTTVDVIMGDARIKLEQQLKEKKPQGFDVLVVDAFSSDAIPLHLLTKECFQTYLQHLSKRGVLAIHISNRFLDLDPICYNLAKDAGQESIYVSNRDDDSTWSDASSWVLVTNNKKLLAAIDTVVTNENDNDNYRTSILGWDYLRKKWKPGAKDLVWTDDFASLASIVDWDMTSFVKEQWQEVMDRLTQDKKEEEDEE